jgi:hypothetical protein
MAYVNSIDSAAIVLSRRQRFAILTGLTIASWAVPSVVVYGLLQLL